MLRVRLASFAVVALCLGASCAPTTLPQMEAGAYESAEEAAQAAEELDNAPTVAPPPVLASHVPRIVSNGPRNRMRVALTFDACSGKTSQYDERVTKILEQTQTPATIFLGGAWVRQEPDIVLSLAENPLFELGNHTYTHPHLPKVASDGRVFDELMKTQREIYDLTGRLPEYMRPPYGEVDGRVSYWAAQAGLTTVEYDLASGDPDLKHGTKDRLVAWVLLKARPGSIIVMHMNHKNFHTAEALPDIIKGLRQKGFELVTVGTLLHDGTEPTCRQPSEARPSPFLNAVSRRLVQ